MLIANPLYDVVFKYLLEDRKVATIFLSAIIGETIEELDFSATENTIDVPTDRERILTVCRFDFSAKIKTDKGYKAVAIELQKAKYASDILRFRRYLAKHYENQNNIYKEGDEEKARQIYAVYLLNYDIGLPDCPVITVDYITKDYATGNTVIADNEFIKSLQHKSWIVQMKQLKERRRNSLEKLLDVFGKGAENDRQHALNISDEEIPEEYAAVIRRLLHAQADEQVRGAMDLEDEIIEELRKKERENEEKDKIIEEKDKKLEQNKKELKENKKELKEKDKKLEQNKKELEQKDKANEILKKELEALKKRLLKP